MAYLLSEIINELLVELGESQNNKFSRFYQLGFSFLRDVRYNNEGVLTTKELCINDNDTVDLPLGYIQYTNIALMANGRLFSLGPDNSLSLFQHKDSCGNEISNRTLPQSVTGFPIANPLVADNYRNGEYMGRNFGAGADNNVFGYYRIDRAKNRIILSNLASPALFFNVENRTDTSSSSRARTIILEYISDIESVEGDFQVHPFCINALKEYIVWKYKARSNKPLGEQQMAEQSFNNAARIMRFQLTNSTKQEWIAAFQSGNKATPKV